MEYECFDLCLVNEDADALLTKGLNKRADRFLIFVGVADEAS